MPYMYVKMIVLLSAFFNRTKETRGKLWLTIVFGVWSLSNSHTAYSDSLSLPFPENGSIKQYPSEWHLSVAGIS